ncbi:alpha/beta fold hydrolase [Anianabacter salinae]|uniref:alpha/beta fold hydrolase n=1 Tax=Anianabacter salinae TaxID=2851023 RepID=UPI00225DF96F|nr:alpha/beta hydrolase [Anianabacter salinae]MBV0914094.1 alpha/beta hydrolase [Anianabacter salinae]
MADAAPFLADLADGPEGGHAVWTHAADGVRLRIGLWPRADAAGTVLLFPGRTEYIEKYGRAARDLAARGLATVAIDWRGQGLADRLLPDAAPGHVADFADYQLDVAALVAVARAQGLPEPYTLIGHSMGGCIGLRAVMDGLPVKAAAFSAPMWGIAIAGMMRPAAWALSWAARRINLGHAYPPGTSGESYAAATPFDDNMLTRDREMFDYMRRQVVEKPELALGGPSYQWLNEALTECRALSRLPAPDLPCVTFLGTHERIVDPGRIHARMAQWPRGRLEIVDGGEHETMMERPEVRARFFDAVAGIADA